MQYRWDVRAQRRNQNSAFTLVELMVVMAIIGILAALLFEAISQAKGKALRIQCVNNLHQLGVGLQNFLAENHSYPAAIALTNSDIPGRWWADQLERGGFDISKPATNFLEKGVWLCPSAHWPNIGPGGYPSYSYNAFGVLKVGDRSNALGLHGHYTPGSGTIIPIGESEVVNPSDMMAIGENLFGSFIYFMRVDLAENEKWNAPARHQGRANVVFGDGHVESPTLKFLFEETSDEALSRWNRDHQPHREKLSP
jgi:prepilin-type N-terminal cleavage/methylation domain-containing protein/prepilin-type processing-associated H-X9-DG protein